MASRLDEIRRMLFTQKKVFVSDLSRLFETSAVTIRKDLTALELEGVAQRVYGGAVLAQDALPPMFEREGDSVRAALADAACLEIEDGDNLFLGSGQTCCYLAKRLVQFKRLSVVTNNITALGDLLKTDARVYLIGGEVTSTDAQTMFSSPESPEAENICVNKAFTSISGVDLQAGLTVRSIISTYIYRRIPSMAKSWYLMADSQKFDKIAMYPVAELQAVKVLITDGLPESYRGEAERQEIEIRLAGAR